VTCAHMVHACVCVSGRERDEIVVTLK